MKHPNPLFLLFLCIGDAFGMAFEYVKDENHRELIDYGEFLQNPKHLKGRPGTYTDDGQMSIAVSEVLTCNPNPSKEDFIKKFLEVFLRDPREGYSAGFQSLLTKLTRDEEGRRLKNITDREVKRFQKEVLPTSTKNGGAMRAVPIGVLKTPERVLEVAKLQASVTHDTAPGILAAQAVALMAHFAFYTDEPFDRLQEYGGDHLKGFELFDTPWSGPVMGGHGPDTAHAVCHLLRTYETLDEVLKEACKLGGDTDTVAAISVGIASIRMKNSLPGTLQWLHESDYGNHFLEKTGKSLIEAYK